mgnify:FL=1
MDKHFLNEVSHAWNELKIFSKPPSRLNVPFLIDNNLLQVVSDLATMCVLGDSITWDLYFLKSCRDSMICIMLLYANSDNEETDAILKLLIWTNFRDTYTTPDVLKDFNP